MKKTITYCVVIGMELLLIFAFCFHKEDNSKTLVSYNDNMFKMADSVLLLYEGENTKEEEDITLEEEEETTEETVELTSEESTIIEVAPEPEVVVEAVPEPVIEQSVNNDISYLQSYARNLVINEYGWTEQDYLDLVSLWQRESGWNVTSSNPNGAYGIPQAYPGYKMSAFGDDWATNGQTQIRWGLNYIKNQYSTPSNAWANFCNYGWY